MESPVKREFCDQVKVAFAAKWFHFKRVLLFNEQGHINDTLAEQALASATPNLSITDSATRPLPGSAEQT